MSSTGAEDSGDTPTLERILSCIDVSPQTFFQPSASLQAASLVAAKRMIDPIVNQYSVFRELALKGMDVEQVWEQVKVVADNVAALVDQQKDVRGVEKSNGLQNADFLEESSEDARMVEEAATDSENVSNESEDVLEDESDDGNETADGQEEEDGSEEDEEDDEENNDEDLDYDEFPENPEADAESGEEIDTSAETSKPLKKDVHGLNDEFFSIDDFNRLTEQQDAAGSDIGDDEIDFYAGICFFLGSRQLLILDPDEQASDSDDKHAGVIKYADFYRPPENSAAPSRKRKRVGFDKAYSLAIEDEVDDEARAVRFQKDLFANADTPAESEQPDISTYAKRRAVIKAQVEQLEKENIAEKEWMYIGEASSRDRPKNSLLEVAEEIDVERSAKPVPIVTEERTQSLEEIIKQRIMANNFDDVKRKLPPALLQKSREIEEDPDMQEPGAKPTRSLAEIYEQEHLRRIDPTNNPTPLSLSVQKHHAEIDSLWRDLSHQLDTLTSWRFIPAPENTEERVISNIPAVDMEDARPEAEAGATMLAPQEVYRPRAEKGEVIVGGVPIAKGEMSREEKARARKRQGRQRVRMKKPVVQGEKKDVVDTLKRGGVKIISNGKGRRVRGPNAFREYRKRGTGIS